jgi:hypothetical protein
MASTDILPLSDIKFLRIRAAFYPHILKKHFADALKYLMHKNGYELCKKNSFPFEGVVSVFSETRPFLATSPVAVSKPPARSTSWLAYTAGTASDRKVSSTD